MKVSETLLTLAVVFGIAVGQILFKLAAVTLSSDGSFWVRWLNPYLIIALCVYGLATLLWVWVLRTVPLHLAYPLMALAFLFVPTLAYIFLGEPFQPKVFWGGALIMLGVYISVR
jgi:drug/metabolite transporter (DMT)-like permease